MIVLDGERARAAILDTLNHHGIRMNMKTFESTLYRIRKQRRAAADASPTGDQQTSDEQLKTQETPHDTTQGPPVREGFATSKQRRRQELEKYADAEPPNPFLEQLLNKQKREDE